MKEKREAEASAYSDGMQIATRWAVDHARYSERMTVYQQFYSGIRKRTGRVYVPMIKNPMDPDKDALQVVIKKIAAFAHASDQQLEKKLTYDAWLAGALEGAAGVFEEVYQEIKGVSPDDE